MDSMVTHPSIVSEYYDFFWKTSFHSFYFPNVFHRYRIAGNATKVEVQENAKAPKSVTKTCFCAFLTSRFF